jgi:hypothetical protein
VSATSRSGKPEIGEEIMTARARWRPVREGHEKEDRAFNEALADRLLADPAIDDVVIAFGLLNWRLIGPDGEKWPMAERTVCVPDWAVSVSEQDRDARRGAAIAVAIDRRRPSHVPGQKPLCGVG